LRQRIALRMNRKLNRIHTEELRMAETWKAHPEDEMLELYALGRLDEPELGVVEEHILICAACQERLDEATEYAGLMREAAAKVAVEQPVEAAWRKWLRLDWLPVPMPALAGAMVVLVAVMVWHPWRAVAPAEWRTVELETMRGEAAGATAVEGFGLDLRLDIAGLDAGGATAQIVEATGGPVAELTVAIDGGKASVRYAAGLQAGRYWVRLKKSGETLREYSLTVRGR
jgi:hypothetical protein